jgi:hypothetical protein
MKERPPLELVIDNTEVQKKENCVVKSLPLGAKEHPPLELVIDNTEVQKKENRLRRLDVPLSFLGKVFIILIILCLLAVGVWAAMRFVYNKNKIPKPTGLKLKKRARVRRIQKILNEIKIPQKTKMNKRMGKRRCEMPLTKTFSSLLFRLKNCPKHSVKMAAASKLMFLLGEESRHKFCCDNKYNRKRDRHYCSPEEILLKAIYGSCGITRRIKVHNLNLWKLATLFFDPNPEVRILSIAASVTVDFPKDREFVNLLLIELLNEEDIRINVAAYSAITMSENRSKFKSNERYKKGYHNLVEFTNKETCSPIQSAMKKLLMGTMGIGFYYAIKVPVIYKFSTMFDKRNRYCPLQK